MVQCEMCGAETGSPETIRTEGAELDVCSDCADFGTTVETSGSSSTSTKYSTGDGGGGSSGGSSTGSTGGSRSSGGGGSRTDLFDEMDELVTDYDDRIRRARERAELSQAELADELNEKASLIRKLERGETLPSDDVQGKVERFLEIDLTGDGGGEADADWDGGGSAGGYTLGDVVERKD